jgi:hypothetical protein
VFVCAGPELHERQIRQQYRHACSPQDIARVLANKDNCPDETHDTQEKEKYLEYSHSILRHYSI